MNENRAFFQTHVNVGLKDPWDLLEFHSGTVEGELTLRATIWSEHEPVIPPKCSRWGPVFPDGSDGQFWRSLEAINHGGHIDASGDLKWIEHMSCSDGLFWVVRTGSGWYLVYQRSPPLKYGHALDGTCRR